MSLVFIIKKSENIFGRKQKSFYLCSKQTKIFNEMIHENEIIATLIYSAITTLFVTVAVIITYRQQQKKIKLIYKEYRKVRKFNKELLNPTPYEKASYKTLMHN